MRDERQLVGALRQDGGMAKTPGEPPRKSRFSKSGHTSHQPRLPHPYDAPSYDPPPPPRRANGPVPPDSYRPEDGYSTPRYHGSDAPPPAPPASRGKAALNRTNQAARVVTNKVINASKANGAHESGLTALIWNQVLSYGTDAMITVALAGTVFFGASAHAQRGNVLLYLLVTMAPFAVVAPIIGPALDRLQHGRRWTMAGTAIGRGVLAIIMAGHPTELL